MSLPSADVVTRNLRDLFSKPVTVKVAPVLPVSKAAFVAVYLDPSDAPMALGLADLPFAAVAGAALAMIPAAVAMESVRRNRVEENLRENFHEVVNILAAALNAASGEHVKLGPLVTPAQTPASARAILEKPAKRVDFDVKVADYGAGKLSFLIAPGFV